MARWRAHDKPNASDVEVSRLQLEKYEQETGNNPTPQDTEEITVVAKGHRCMYQESKCIKNLSLMFDDGSTVALNKETIVQANSVFEAMLVGRFTEASQAEVKLPKTSRSSMLRIVHYLYGCRRWAGEEGCCREQGPEEANSSTVNESYEDDLDMLLDLVPLSDKYLLTELNRIVCRMIVKQCMQDPEGKMKMAYKRSLNIVCPTANITTATCNAVETPKVKERCPATPPSANSENNACSSSALNVQLVAFLLAGNIRHEIRVKLFRELAKLESDISSDFVDDINQIIRSCLKIAMKKPKPFVIKQFSPDVGVKAYKVIPFKK